MKGQYFSLDVIVAGIIAIMAITLLVNYWQYSLQNTPLYKDALNKEAIKATQLLFSVGSEYSIFAPGNPSMLATDYAKNDPYEDMKKRIAELDDRLPGNLCVFITLEGESREELTSCGDVAGYVKVERMAYVENEGIKLAFLEIYYGY